MLPVIKISYLLLFLTFDLIATQDHDTTLVPNEVIRVDLRTYDNSVRHHTSQYRQNNLGSSIVLRRGDSFNVSLQLRDIYNVTNDKIRLELSLSTDKSSLVYLPILRETKSTLIETSKWSLRLVNDKTDKLYMNVYIPSNASIGVWRLKFSVKLAGGRDLRSYSVRESLYIIFNPWSEDDTVYMAREDARQEYVLNEVGKIYQGTSAATTGKIWHYGQFSEYVLTGMMMLLDKARLTATARSDVVKISRAVSGLMNSHDDNGLMVGNWSGNYRDGISPWDWTGSAVIFERYVRSGGYPVKFGQCWVFGGLTTTALRTLGIPARTISNFVSAHDTDLTLTVDQYHSDRGEKLSGVGSDSIWNFHCWSDAWMIREDLPPEYSGWQAIDATPQEMSNGSYQLGPASLEAIKQGKTQYGYDVAFVYSEVNAEHVTWRPDSRSQFKWRRVSITTDHVGKKILTKKIGVMVHSGISDAEDITDQYKYREGTKEERYSYNLAYKSTGNEHL